MPQILPLRKLNFLDFFLSFLSQSDTFHLLFIPQGLNNIIHIDFDYKKEFIYWVDSTRPNGRKINRMRLNGSDLKVETFHKMIPGPTCGVNRLISCHSADGCTFTLLFFSPHNRFPSFGGVNCQFT